MGCAREREKYDNDERVARVYFQSQCSIPSGLLKLPDVSNKIATNNLIAGQFPRRISLVTAVVNPPTRDSSSRYIYIVIRRRSR